MKYYYVQVTKNMGRGLFAARNIDAGTEILVAELLVLSERDTQVVNLTDLQYYTFKYNDKQDCLVLGDGELFNHDSSANVRYDLVDYGDRKVMVFTAIRNIKADQQLLTDYSHDVEVDIQLYNNINLVG